MDADTFQSLRAWKIISQPPMYWQSRTSKPTSTRRRRSESWVKCVMLL
jgi:hypothetical protein